MRKKKNKIEEVDKALRDEDVREFQAKIEELKPQYEILRDVAKDIMADIANTYIAAVEETLRKAGYTNDTVKHLYRKSLKSLSTGAFVEIIYERDDTIVMLNSITFNRGGAVITIRSRLYDVPKQYVIAYGE